MDLNGGEFLVKVLFQSTGLVSADHHHPRPPVPPNTVRLCRIGAVLTLSLPLAALPSAAQVRCDSQPTPGLTLEQSIPLNLPQPPRAIAFSPILGPILVDAAGRLHYAATDTALPQFPDTLVLRGVAPFGSTVVAFSDRDMFTLLPDTSGWQRLALPEPLYDIRSILTDHDRATIWILSGQAGGQVLRIRPYGTTEPARIEGPWTVTGTWRAALAHDEGILLLATHAPFEVVTLGEDGPTTVLRSLTPPGLSQKGDSLAAIFASSLLPFDCDSYLGSFADLRSSQRWLVTFRPEPPRVLASTEIDSTMGFFQFDADHRRLYAYHNTADGGEVLVYRLVSK